MLVYLAGRSVRSSMHHSYLNTRLHTPAPFSSTKERSPTMAYPTPKRRGIFHSLVVMVLYQPVTLVSKTPSPKDKPEILPPTLHYSTTLFFRFHLTSSSQFIFEYVLDIVDNRLYSARSLSAIASFSRSRLCTPAPGGSSEGTFLMM